LELSKLGGGIFLLGEAHGGTKRGSKEGKELE